MVSSGTATALACLCLNRRHHKVYGKFLKTLCFGLDHAARATAKNQPKKKLQIAS